ncbi:MAG: NAD(P)/FAD-dependent oxidoreductase [bacterium]
MEKKRIAIIGAGVSGLTASWLLHKHYAVTLFEKNDYLGGHTNTVLVEEATQQLPVDTGFIVFNDRNYPNLEGLFNELNVATQASDMSFAFSLQNAQQRPQLEYAGSSLSTLFAQRNNLLSLAHWQMLWEITRFNRLALQCLQQPESLTLSLGEFLEQHRFSQRLQDYYLLPMGAAIWSCPLNTMMAFPARSFLQFFANHGLLTLNDRPQWYTVTGGSFCYIKAMMATMQAHIQQQPAALRVRREAKSSHSNNSTDSSTMVYVQSENGEQAFDAVIFACHGDQALALLSDSSDQEQALLQCFNYEDNATYLHTDQALMPHNRKVWSSWNYLARQNDESRQQMTASYWMNRLQQLDTTTDYFVTLNPYQLPKDDHIIREIHYHHPIFTQAAMDAQQQMPTIQGQQQTWFCGSYLGYGFHEDAVLAALKVCLDFGVQPAWSTLYNDQTETPQAQAQAQAQAQS